MSSPTLPNARKRDFTHYVSLDLGSETMAAYCEEKGSGGGDLIQLYDEVLAQNLLNVSLSNANLTPELFKDEDGDHFRLRTRISLEDNRQRANLVTDHAVLDFLNSNHADYAQSLFTYFHAQGQTLRDKMLPNPKIATQYGGQEIMPFITPRMSVGAAPTPVPNPVQYQPELLLKHLVVQVIRNFVKFGLGNLNNLLVPNPPREIQDIHLVLTVPNIYSRDLVNEIREFVDKHAGVAKVSIVSESDALAYYVRKNPQSDTFKTAFQNPEIARDFSILTFDMGRGTTDLSLIQFEQPAYNRSSNLEWPKWLRIRRGRSTVQLNTSNVGGSENVKEHHTIRARTGRSDGGNKLSYIFAEFYSKRMEDAFSRHGEVPLWNFINVRATTRQRSATGNQVPALLLLEDLIERVKRSFVGAYLGQVGIFFIKLSKQEQQNRMREILNLLFQEQFTPFTANDTTDPHYKLFEDVLRSLTLSYFPLLIRRPSQRRRREATLGIAKNRKPTLDNAARLGKAIGNYVDQNVNSLIEDLIKMAENVLDSDRTFAVVAGRASQFSPVKLAIKSSLRSLDFNRRIKFLSKDDAKYACCKGAISYARIQSEIEILNRDAQFGTYGFLAPVYQPEMFKPIDMTKSITDPNGYEVTFQTPREYIFIYTVRPFTDDESSQSIPDIDDGMTVSRGVFKGNRFRVRYSNNAVRIATYNDKSGKYGREETIGGLMNFGSVPGNKDKLRAVFERLWPEALLPKS